MRRFLSILLALVLILALATIVTTAEGGSKLGQNTVKSLISREQFFMSLSDALGLKPAKNSLKSFPDYDDSNEAVNALINENYIFGRLDGTLGLGDPLNDKDADMLLHRLIWPVETKFVSLGSPRSARDDSGCDGVHHKYSLDESDGVYKCSCGDAMPIGTNKLFVLEAPETDSNELRASLSSKTLFFNARINNATMYVTYDTEDDEGLAAYLAVNTLCYLYKDGAYELSSLKDLELAVNADSGELYGYIEVVNQNDTNMVKVICFGEGLE